MGSPEIICRSLASQFTTILCLEVLQHWTNFYFSFTDYILTMLDPGAGGGGGSTQLKMEYSHVPPLRPFFHALLTLP